MKSLSKAEKNIMKKTTGIPERLKQKSDCYKLLKNFIEPILEKSDEEEENNSENDKEEDKYEKAESEESEDEDNSDDEAENESETDENPTNTISNLPISYELLNPQYKKKLEGLASSKSNTPILD
jgi:TATA-binding protein-associated factor Taf7